MVISASFQQNIKIKSYLEYYILFFAYWVYRKEVKCNKKNKSKYFKRGLTLFQINTFIFFAYWVYHKEIIIKFIKKTNP